MASPNNTLKLLTRDQPIQSNDIPFPSAAGDSKPNAEMEASISSKLTSSDKLTALRSASSPPHGRPRTPTSVHSRAFSASRSPPSLFSPSPPVATTELALIASQRASLSEVSVGRDTAKQRVSFDSDRSSLSSFQNLKQSLAAQLHRNSDPSPYHRKENITTEPSVGSHPHSRTNSRAHSPRRLFQWPGLHRGPPREEPFIPVDPFKLRYRLKGLSKTTGVAHDQSQHEMTSSEHGGGRWCQSNCTDVLPTHFCSIPAVPTLSWSNCRTFFQLFQHNITIVIPREIYITLFMFRLPSLYFSRVARLFEEAEVSRPDIQRMIDACAPHTSATNNDGDRAMGAGIASTAGVALGAMGQILPFPEDWTPPAVSPALARFKNSWEVFIESLLREWKTQNVVSALLLSAILTMFQIEPAASDPLTRTAALLSLICALMSLSYGCMYIIRFGTMRSMYKASRWAEEARRTNTILWWNVWVLLAMPAVWLAWSMVLFVTAILSFVWRTDATNDPQPRPPLSPRLALGPRIAITGVFAIGMVYLVLIVRTLKSYGGSRTRIVRGQDPLWRIGSGEIGLTGAPVGGERVRERDGERESRPGRERERERRPPGGLSRREALQAQERWMDRQGLGSAHLA